MRIPEGMNKLLGAVGVFSEDGQLIPEYGEGR